MVTSHIRTHSELLCLYYLHRVWSPVRDAHPSHPLPTRPARSVVASQGRTPLSPPAYETRTKRGRQSGTHTPLTPCLRDPHEAWSPVRDAHPTPLTPCLRDPHEAWSPVRDAHPTPLTPCLRDPHEAWSPVRDAHPTPLTPCLRDPHEAWSPVRDAHSFPLYETRTKVVTSHS